MYSREENSCIAAKVIDTVGVFERLVQWQIVLAFDGKSIFRDAGVSDDDLES
jgi:hypothetical protein